MVANVVSPGISIHTLLHAWQTGALSIVALVIQVVLALAYLVGVRRLAARGRSWSHWRTASFLAATITVVVAVQSGLASYDDENFSVHVIQHLLLMNMAPILYALAAPMTLALQASSRRTQRRLLKILHHPLVSFVTNPIVAASMVYVTMIAYFLTPFYNFSLEHPLVHDLSHLHFLIAGTIFWWVIVGADPSRWHLSYPAKLGLLATGIPVTAVLGLALTGARTSMAPAFHSAADIRAGGSILWVVGELTMLGAMGLLLYQWMRFDERVAIRADRRADQEAARASLPTQGD
jgi:putative copper resistance protein D